MPLLHLSLTKGRVAALTAACIAPVIIIRACKPGIQGIMRRMLSWTKVLFFSPSPLPKNLQLWHIFHDEDLVLLTAEVEGFTKAWNYLKPIFASHGYIFYQFFNASGSNLIAAPSHPKMQPTHIPEYPYARRVYVSDVEATFSNIISLSLLNVFPRSSMKLTTPTTVDASMACPRFIGARRGYKVSIMKLHKWSCLTTCFGRVVADDVTTNELDVHGTLNTAEMRADPRNHTIAIIEYVKVERYTFVVMPR